MDEQVLRGMAKWPNVPAVYGWLGLDRRGTWLLQRAPITNPTIAAYIGRNYERERDGRWFFQNGPQRVYVALDYTPYVYRGLPEAGQTLALETHTGRRAATLLTAWMDENGTLLLETEHGIGVLHDHDLDRALEALEGPHGVALDETTLEETLERVSAQGEAPVWLKLGSSRAALQSIESSEVPQRFGFVREPRPEAAA